MVPPPKKKKKFLFGDDVNQYQDQKCIQNKLIRKINLPRKQPPQKFKPQYRPRKQSAKNSSKFSNRRVVFKQGNFRQQKQDANRIKTETTKFQWTEKMTNFQSTGRALFYLKS